MQQTAEYIRPGGPGGPRPIRRPGPVHSVRVAAGGERGMMRPPRPARQQIGKDASRAADPLRRDRRSDFRPPEAGCRLPGPRAPPGTARGPEVWVRDGGVGHNCLD